MIFNYLVDESLPSTIPFWNKKKFAHASGLVNICYDTDIWQHALENDLVIITKDTNFYYRSLAASGSPKVVWVRTSAIKKKKFNKRLKACWKKVEKQLLLKSFIVLKFKK